MKIAFFDIDGTLINVPHGLLKPTKETIRVLKEFQKQGHYIVIASARGSLPNELKEIPFDGYIFNDGHYILFHDEVMLDDIFLKEEIEKQMNIYQKYHGRYMFSGHHQTWNAFLDDEYVIKHRQMFQGTTKRPKDVIEDYEAKDVQAVACCVLFSCLEELEACYEELKDDFTMVVYRSGLLRMDVYRKGLRKGTACEYLYNKLNIEKEKTYAFGDGINDVEMIKLVGHGIAMGNGVNEIKEIADDITDSVDDDGIAKAFQKYFQI